MQLACWPACVQSAKKCVCMWKRWMGSVKVKLVEVGDSVSVRKGRRLETTRLAETRYRSNKFTTHGLTRISQLPIAEHPETSSDISSIFHVVSAPRGLRVVHCLCLRIASPPLPTRERRAACKASFGFIQAGNLLLQQPSPPLFFG